MPMIYKCGFGVVFIATLGIVLAGCSKIGGEKYPLDVTDLDPFTQAMHYAKTGDTGNLESVIADNADIVSEWDQTGTTLLHYAAVASQPDTVKLLIDRGADVNAINDANQTPLEVAEEEHADEKVIEILLDAGGQ